MQQRVHPRGAVDVLHARVPAHRRAYILAPRPHRRAVGHDRQALTPAHEVDSHDAESTLTRLAVTPKQFMTLHKYTHTHTLASGK